jgi:thioredoxin 1
MGSDRELEKIKEDLLKKMMKTNSKLCYWRNGEVIKLTDVTFHKAILNTDKPVLVDFWADWCLPCKMMSPIIHQLAKEYAGRAYIAKLNVDNNVLTATKYGVMSIPYFIVFKGGHPVGQVVGAVGKHGLESLLMRSL